MPCHGIPGTEFFSEWPPLWGFFATKELLSKEAVIAVPKLHAELGDDFDMMVTT